MENENETLKSLYTLVNITSVQLITYFSNLKKGIYWVRSQ